MGDLSNALQGFENFISNSLDDYEGWEITNSYYENYDGTYFGNVDVTFSNMEQWEIENLLDGALGNWFEEDGSWEWDGDDSVEISGMIWNPEEDGEPNDA